MPNVDKDDLDDLERDLRDHLEDIDRKFDRLLDLLGVMIASVPMAAQQRAAIGQTLVEIKRTR